MAARRMTNHSLYILDQSLAAHQQQRALYPAEHRDEAEQLLRRIGEAVNMSQREKFRLKDLVARGKFDLCHAALEEAGNSPHRVLGHDMREMGPV